MGRRRIAVGVMAGALMLAGCSTVRGWIGSDDQALPGVIESVHAAAVANDVAVFRVSSNGCTGKGDLQPVVRRGLGYTLLQLRRVKEDSCRQPQPQGVELRWTFEELGLRAGQRVTIENPYQITPTA